MLRGPRLITSGVVPLTFTARAKRVAEALDLVHSWIGLYQPATVVLERTSRHPRRGLNRVHDFAESVARCARRRGIQVATYSAQVVRKRLVGDGWAGKDVVAQAIAQRYPALRVYLTQDRAWKERYWHNMFDAIALALHHQTTPPPSRSRSCG